MTEIALSTKSIKRGEQKLGEESQDTIKVTFYRVPYRGLKIAITLRAELQRSNIVFNSGLEMATQKTAASEIKATAFC